MTANTYDDAHDAHARAGESPAQPAAELVAVAVSESVAAAESESVAEPDAAAADVLDVTDDVVIADDTAGAEGHHDDAQGDNDALDRALDASFPTIPLAPRPAGTPPPVPAEPMSDLTPAGAGPLIQPGMIVDERYLVESVLSETGLRGTYRARRIGLRLDAWLRRVELLAPPSERAKEAYVRDARAIACASDPVIARVLDVGWFADGSAYYVTPRLTAYPLKAWVAIEVPPRATALALISRLLRALDSLHQVNVIHGALSPECVFADADGSVHVLDVGVQHLRTLGHGSAPYEAPELALGEAAGPGADVYSAGVLLYQLLAGHVPFVGATAEELQDAKLNQEPATPEGIPMRLAAVVDRALAPSLRDRFLTAAEFRAALEGFATETIQSEVAQNLEMAGADPDAVTERLVVPDPDVDDRWVSLQEESSESQSSTAGPDKVLSHAA